MNWVPVVGIIVTLSVLFQCVTTYMGFRLFRFMRPVKTWTTAWGFFTTAAFLIAIRRVLSLWWFWNDTYGFRIHGSQGMDQHLLEAAVLFVVTILLLVFILKIKDLFIHYSGEDEKKILEDK